MAMPEHTRPRALLPLAGWVVVVLVLASGAASLGAEHAPWIAFGVILESLFTGGALAGAYLVSAYGLGWLARPLWRGAAEPALLRLATGLVILLTLSHGLGVLGLLHPWVAAGSLLPGIVLALVSLRRERAAPERERTGWTQWLWAPGVALLIAAAANPPGWLWGSEARGFDALSYHLQLPQEWLAMGRIAPLDHNVYSYLPGYLEAAFTHLGAASFAAEPSPERPLLAGLLAGSGWRANACQFLHAWIAVLAAWGVGRCVRVALGTAETSRGPAAALAPSLAGAIVLLTPWTLVTGSLAYNEMGVVLLGAAALAAALDTGLAPGRRALLVGLLVGGACCLKPTALLLIAPGIGLVWAMGVPRTRWVPGTLLIAGAGVAAIAPWLIRNAAASGNPVFPHFSGVFGLGHWSAEQHERYHRAHFAAEPLFERLGLAVWPWGDAARGLTHTQWGGFFVGVLVLGGVALWQGRAPRSGGQQAGDRRAAPESDDRRPPVLALWLALGAGLGAWLLGTHVQSRFLVPLVVFGGVLIGLGCSGPACSATAGPGRAAAGRRGLARPVISMALAAEQLALSAWTFARQSGGDPNGALLDGVHGLSGEAYRATIQAMPRGEREARLGALSDIRTLNLTLPPNEPIYLLGDSAPLLIRSPKAYTTTWDRSLLAGVTAAHPSDFAAWTTALRDAGYEYVLINFAELTRLKRAGWLDPHLDPEAIGAWARTAAAGKTWPDSGRVLIRLGGEP